MTNFYKVLNLHTGVRKLSKTKEEAIGWLGAQFQVMCEKMPTKDEYHLPCFLDWKDIWNRLNEHLQSCGYNHCNYETLAKWQTEFFPTVKAPKYTQLGKCDL